MVVDDLNGMQTRESEKGAIEGFVVGKDRTEVSHLQFADGTIILFLLHDNKSISNAFMLLRVVEQMSSLHINMTKFGLERD